MVQELQHDERVQRQLQLIGAVVRTAFEQWQRTLHRDEIAEGAIQRMERTGSTTWTVAVQQVQPTRSVIIFEIHHDQLALATVQSELLNDDAIVDATPRLLTLANVVLTSPAVVHVAYERLWVCNWCHATLPSTLQSGNIQAIDVCTFPHHDECPVAMARLIVEGS